MDGYLDRVEMSTLGLSTAGYLFPRAGTSAPGWGGGWLHGPSAQLIPRSTPPVWSPSIRGRNAGYTRRLERGCSESGRAVPRQRRSPLSFFHSLTSLLSLGSTHRFSTPGVQTGGGAALMESWPGPWSLDRPALSDNSLGRVETRAFLAFLAP